jgi:Cu2+-exporting ATPase
MMSDPSMAAAMERDMRHRFLVSLILTIPVVLYSELGEAIFGATPPDFGLGVQWMAFGFATPVVLYGGWVFIRGTVEALRSRRLDMSVLITTGVAAAYLFSAGITLSGGTEVFFEAAAMLITFVLFGHWMEMKSRRGTTDALRALLALVPERAIVVRDGVEVEVDTADVMSGDLVRIRPGQRVPVDGVIESGTSSLDESLVSGESLPVERSPGDVLVAGSVNGEGALLIRASGTGSETVLGRIIALVQNAQASKAPAQRLADRAAAVLVVVAIGSGLVTFAAWSAFSTVSTLTALTFAISAIVIACPDALGLATPTVVAVGTGLGARHKVLIKDAATLESLSRIDAIVLDKTGTLTEGKPRVVELVAMEGWDQKEVLRLAAGLEASSSHPLALAVVAKAHDDGLHALPGYEHAENVPGYGTVGLVEGRRVVAGNLELLRREGIDTAEIEREASRVARAGRSVVAIGIDGKAAGLVAIADVIRPSAAPTVAALRRLGIEVTLLTGDNEGTATAVAREAGIERVFANVKPGDKADYVRQLQSEGRKVAMVGDGINDAPALAVADIGIAIGAGTDVAIETASVVLMRSDPADILKAIDLSRATVRKMKQNLFWASIYNLLAIPVAAGALYNATGVQLRPEVAALLMSLSSIIVATNAVLLKRENGRLESIGDAGRLAAAPAFTPAGAA